MVPKDKVVKRDGLGKAKFELQFPNKRRELGSKLMQSSDPRDASESGKGALARDFLLILVVHAIPILFPSVPISGLHT